MHAKTAHDEKESHHSWTFYLWVWVALLVLTVVTYALAQVDTGRFHLVVAMAVATVKAMLVVLFFMHLAEQRGANRIVLLVSVIFVGLLISLTVADVATRFPLANPPTAPRPASH